VFDVLQSFVEGEEAVQEVVIAEQKAKAAEEAERLALAEAAEKANAEAKESVQEEDTAVEKAKDLISGLLDSEAEPEPVTEVETPTTPVVAEEPTIVASEDYKNLIDSRAYNYESQSLGFSLKVPFAFWFRNFGALTGSKISIGVADNPVNTTRDVKMWVRVLSKDNPAEGTTELITGSGVTLIKKRDATSVYEITGPIGYRDALWSIADSIVQ